jgi:putative hydrolase of the HAD superfamily
LAQLGLAADKETQQTYANAIESQFNQPSTLRTYPEVVEVLTKLREQGYRLGIVSNWSWNLRERVAQVALDGFFELVWASAYAGCNKPHPGIFRQALAQMGLSQKRTLYVGDSYEHDVIGARNAGLEATLLDRDGTADSPDCPVVPDLWGVSDLLAR